MLRVLAGLFEVLTVIGACIGAVMLFSGLLPGNTAIQTGASSAAAAAFAIIPYTIAGVLHRAAMRGLLDAPADYEPAD